MVQIMSVIIVVDCYKSVGSVQTVFKATFKDLHIQCHISVLFYSLARCFVIKSSSLLDHPIH